MEQIGAQLLGEIWENGQPANENFDVDMEEGDDRDGDGTLDGGVAINTDSPGGGGSSSSSKRRSADCDLVRLTFFPCRL